MQHFYSLSLHVFRYSRDNLARLQDPSSRVNVALAQADALKSYLKSEPDFADKFFVLGDVGIECVLLVTGALMAARRRFDIVITLWGGLTLAVFLLGVLVYVNALDRGLDDAVAFDATLIMAAFGLWALVLRPAFRD